MTEPTLNLAFRFDKPSGKFEVTLPNSAKFFIELRDCGGKLRENLDLFRAALSTEEDRFTRKSEKQLLRERIAAGSVGVPVNRIGKPKDTISLTLEDLGL